MTAIEARPIAASTARSGADGAAEEILQYERSPRDLLRLLVYTAVALLLIALTIWVEDSVLGFEEDIVRLFNFISPSDRAGAARLPGVDRAVHLRAPS